MRIHSFRTPALVATSALTLVLLAGCSSSSSSSTTSTTSTSNSSKTYPVDTVPNVLPATGSVNGVTVAVVSTPAKGNVGLTMNVTATINGTVHPSTLDFQITDAAYFGKGKPATNQSLTVNGPGVYKMPKGFKPPSAGTWSVTVNYQPTDKKYSSLSISGLPQTEGGKPPFPQLQTIVTK